MTTEKEFAEYEAELLSCPFCGGFASLKTVSGSRPSKPVIVVCTECKVRTESRGRKCNAVKLWNKREYK